MASTSPSKGEGGTSVDTCGAVALPSSACLVVGKNSTELKADSAHDRCISIGKRVNVGRLVGNARPRLDLLLDSEVGLYLMGGS